MNLRLHTHPLQPTSRFLSPHPHLITNDKDRGREIIRTNEIKITRIAFPHQHLFLVIFLLCKVDVCVFVWEVEGKGGLICVGVGVWGRWGS
jgi:hypothetical protein